LSFLLSHLLFRFKRAHRYEGVELAQFVQEQVLRPGFLVWFLPALITAFLFHMRSGNRLVKSN
jgi:hypothetical protein